MSVLYADPAVLCHPRPEEVSLGCRRGVPCSRYQYVWCRLTTVGIYSWEGRGMACAKYVMGTDVARVSPPQRTPVAPGQSQKPPERGGGGEKAKPCSTRERSTAVHHVLNTRKVFRTSTCLERKRRKHNAKLPACGHGAPPVALGLRRPYGDKQATRGGHSITPERTWRYPALQRLCPSPLSIHAAR